MLCACIFLAIVTVIHAKMETYIVGGDSTEIDKYPQSAFLLVRCQTEKKLMMSKCGASILNQKLLLTAAHCVFRCKEGITIAINVGHRNRQLGSVMSADGFIMHERYDPEENFADIALIRTSKPMIFSHAIRRVAVMPNPPYQEPAFLSGWGMFDEENGVYENFLKEVEQTVHSQSECQKMLDGRLPKGTFCASNTQKNGFASGGDSGSGLLVRGYILIGLVSCKTPELPDVTVYTDVGKYYQWIKFNAQRLYCTRIEI